MTATIERLERGLALLAHLVTLDGDIYLPLFENVERELDALRDKQDVLSRVRQLAASYNTAGGVKAMA